MFNFNLTYRHLIDLKNQAYSELSVVLFSLGCYYFFLCLQQNKTALNKKIKKNNVNSR